MNSHGDRRNLAEDNHYALKKMYSTEDTAIPDLSIELAEVFE